MINEKKITPAVLVAGALGIILYYFFYEMLPNHMTWLYKSYIGHGVFLLLGVYLCYYGIKGVAEIKLYLALVVWGFISRVLNGDFYLEHDLGTVILLIESFLVFAIFAQTDRKIAVKLLNWFSVIYVAVYFVLSVVGLFTIFSNTYINIPPEMVTIRMDASSSSRLKIFANYATVTGVWFFFAWCFSLYNYYRTNKRWVKIVLSFCMVLFYITILLCHGRSVLVALAVACCMLMFKIVYNKLKLSVPVKFTASLAAGGVVFALVLFSYSPVTYWLSRTRDITAFSFRNFYHSLESVPSTEYFGIDESRFVIYEGEEAVYNIIEYRENTADMSGRTDIWLAAIPAIKETPAILLRGNLRYIFMEPVNRFLDDPEIKFQMHNTFMQTLMLLGLPGFLLVVGWTVLIVLKMIKLYFFGNCREMLAIIILMSGFFVLSMVEAEGFTQSFFQGNTFFMVAGVFLSINEASTALSPQPSV